MEYRTSEETDSTAIEGYVYVGLIIEEIYNNLQVEWYRLSMTS